MRRWIEYRNEKPKRNRIYLCMSSIVEWRLVEISLPREDMQ